MKKHDSGLKGKSNPKINTPPNRSTGVPSGLAGSAGRPDWSPVDSPEVASSVTRNLLNPKTVNSQLLLCGIDTLDLGLYVRWDDNWQITKEHLEEKKIAAQSTNGIIDKTDLDREFLHFSSGKPPSYRFQLLFPEYRLYISGSDILQKTPNIYVSILAATLWHEELEDITALLELDLANFGGTVVRIKPSRLDLCADFKLSSPLDLDFLDHFKVSRSRKYKTIHNGDELESYYCGAADSPVQIRIYDKGKEIQVSDKQWFLNLWKIKDASCVWRVEYQLRRSFLKQMKVNDLESLASNLGAIWHYLTLEWFSLRLLDDDKAERRTVHPLWLSVQQAGGKFGEDNGTRRSYEADEMLSVDKILPHIFGRWISIAAQCNLDDRKESMIHLFNLLEKFCDDDKFKNKYREKLIKLGYRGKLGGENHESE
jgi:hypothetical protein